MIFDNSFNMNLHKNKGFLTYIPYIPIPEYSQSNAPINFFFFFKHCIPYPYEIWDPTHKHFQNICLRFPQTPILREKKTNKKQWPGYTGMGLLRYIDKINSLHN